MSCFDRFLSILVHIPLPHNEQLEFYNDLLFSLHKSCYCYELVSPVQFQNYVMSQRHQRWSIEKEFKAVQAFFDSAASKDSFEGNAINIRKYTSSDASKCLAKDTKRTENSIDYVNRLNTELNNLRKLILNFKSSLYHSEHVVKAWKANELMYYDGKFVEISIMMQHISDLDRELNKTLQSMKRKFSNFDIDLAEKKRKRRRQAENAKSDENFKTSRLLARSAEIIKMVAPTDFAHLHYVKMQKEKCITLFISEAEFSSAMLKPRYHANALMYLISSGVFIDRAKENAIASRDAIQKKQIATAEGYKTKISLLIKRKQNLTDKKIDV